jgi:O-antigen/teichoic acid export membrane protein
MVTTGLTWFAVSRADMLIAGRLFTSAAVGVYSFANQLATVPSQKITGIVANVTPSLFRRVRSEPALMRRYVLLVAEALTVVVLPAFIGMVLVAGDFTQVVLGSKWMGIVLPLQLLALHAAFQTCVMPFEQVLWATENGRTVTRYGIASVFVLPPLLFLFGRHYGVNGFAAAWLIGSPLIALPRSMAAMRVIGLPVRQYLRALWPAASSGAVMAGAVLAARHLLAVSAQPPAAQLAVEVLIGAVSYAGALWLLHRGRVRGVATAVRRLRQE